MTERPTGHRHTARDAEILLALGAFLVVLALPVFVGAFLVDERVPALINVAAGLVVGGIGVLMILRGLWTRRHLG